MAERGPIRLSSICGNANNESFKIWDNRRFWIGTQQKTADFGEIERQQEFIRAIADMTRDRATPPAAFVDTYGCQQNEADSERIRGMLAQMGYRFTGEEAEADLIVINTCAVREHAEQRVFGNVGALVHGKRAKPEQIICLCGCMMQESHVVDKIKKSYRHVDLVFGPHALWCFPELLYRVITRRSRLFDKRDESGVIAEGLPVVRQSKVKAWVSIMYGCDNFCSYCIVPFVRGRERSREPEHILEEVRELVRSGCRDITLLGQNVNSYGRGLDTEIDFSGLLEQLNELPGDFLIRCMTSHPKDAGKRLFETMAKCKKSPPTFTCRFRPETTGFCAP
jgi:tRNA-2-methylthio-N6-dimethylallyladenosine synthase